MIPLKPSAVVFQSFNCSATNCHSRSWQKRAPSGVSLMDVLDQLLRKIGTAWEAEVPGEASKKGEGASEWVTGENRRARHDGDEGKRKGEKGSGMSNEIRYSISSDKRNCTFERSSSMLRLSNSVSCSSFCSWSLRNDQSSSDRFIRPDLSAREARFRFL